MSDDEDRVDRELIMVHDITEESTASVVNGFTGDDPLLDMFWYACGRESDAWLLQIMGLLPEWWQPVHRVLARNLDRSHDLEDRPHEDALSRWDDMTVGERRRLRYGWRVIPTMDGGRIYRVADRRAPLIADAHIQVILDEMQVKELGPAETYPRLVQVQ
jgi:hypothetical protein